MHIIFLYLLIIGLFNMVLPKNGTGRKIFIYFSGGLLLMVASFRSLSFGSDIPGYVALYDALFSQSFKQIYWDFIDGVGKDPFFYLFSKSINLAGFSPMVWLSIISLIFLVPVFWIIGKHSPYPFLSIVAFISLGYFSFSLTGLRQTLALAMIVLSYRYLRERSLFKFIGMVLIGSLFHSSALIFLIAYPLSKMKIGLKQIWGIVIALIGALFFQTFILNILSVLNSDERYETYLESGSTLSLSGFVIQLAIYLFCFYYRGETLEKSKELILYNLLFLGVVFQSMSLIIAEFFRVSMYFSIFSIILIPIAISREKNKDKRLLIYFIILCSLVSYIVWTGSFIGFNFFWRD